MGPSKRKFRMVIKDDDGFLQILEASDTMNRTITSHPALMLSMGKRGEILLIEAAKEDGLDVWEPVFQRSGKNIIIDQRILDDLSHETILEKFDDTALFDHV